MKTALNKFVVRSGRCLRMVLHAVRWQSAVLDAFDRAIVQIPVRHFQMSRQVVLGDGEAVVL